MNGDLKKQEEYINLVNAFDTGLFGKDLNYLNYDKPL